MSHHVHPNNYVLPFNYLISFLKLYFDREPYYPALPHEVILLSCKSLPKVPQLYNQKCVNGCMLVQPRVLAYPISCKFMEAYAELHEIHVGKSWHDRCRKAYLHIFGKVPKHMWLSCSGHKWNSWRSSVGRWFGDDTWSSTGYGY